MTFNTCCYYVTYHKPFNLPDRVSNGLKNIQFLDWLQFYLHYSGMRALTKQRKTATAKQNGKGLQRFAAAMRINMNLHFSFCLPKSNILNLNSISADKFKMFTFTIKGE